MAVKTILVRRGLEANRTNITPSTGELIWTTDQHELWVGDGSTAGGIKVTANVEGNYIPNSEKGVANGVATLGADSKIPTSQIPQIAITDVYTVGSESEQLALTAQEGDVAIRTDENKTYIHNGGTAGDMSDWSEMLTPTDAVQSVNGQTGNVVLTTDDISEGSTNLYYTDARVDARINAASIDDLGDVDTSTNAPTNGQVLKWDGSNWVPADESSSVTSVNGQTGAVVLNLDDINDVNAPTTSDGQLLSWDNTASEWQAVDASSVGRTTLVGLDDTPSDYTEANGYTLKVKSDGTGIEFVDESVIDGGTF